MKNDLVNIEWRRRVSIGDHDNDIDDDDDDVDNEEDDDDHDVVVDDDDFRFFQFLAEQVYQMTAKAGL